MTFDDGPHPLHTPRLLDMLKQRGIKATFFVVGQNAAQYPEILKRIHAVLVAHVECDVILFEQFLRLTNGGVLFALDV